MQFLTRTYQLLFFKAFRPRPTDALFDIQSRFSGKSVISISVGKRIKVGVVDIRSDGTRRVSNITSARQENFPDKIFPESIHPALRSLSKLQYAVISVSDPVSTTTKTHSGLGADNEESLLISMSADPKSILQTAESSSAHRLIHDGSTASLSGSIRDAVLSQIDEELAGFRITPVRITQTVLTCFNLILARNGGGNPDSVCVVLDAGSAYVCAPEPRKRWGQIRKLDNCVGDLGRIDGRENERWIDWINETVLSKVKETGGPDKVLVLDAGTSGTVQRFEDFEYFYESAKWSFDHPDLIASTIC